MYICRELKIYIMRLKNYKEYALFDYNQKSSKDDEFKLGDVVISDENEIGVIIQCHGNNEYRTDKFGNCCYDKKYGDIKRASKNNVIEFRPSLLD